MNLARTPRTILRLAFQLGYGLRRILPKQTSNTFGPPGFSGGATIEKIYVINLDREPDRWSRVKNELGRIRDRYGKSLLDLTERYTAIDARNFLGDPPNDADVDPIYTLADQLFVEPQPHTLPSRFELEAPIRMSRAEIAIAKSHIEVWRRIAQGPQAHSLILEDDVWVHPTFSHHLDQAWMAINAKDGSNEDIDILYVSYAEATHGAPKSSMSNHVFTPIKGLWQLSGYTLSKNGAEKLLGLLPCRGPVDLWINHQFSELNVFATRRVIVRQRRDTSSTNSYSALPTLSSIGAISGEGAALFNARPSKQPVFAFGPLNSGQTSLAMALSMLGYRCCSDLDGLPCNELKQLCGGSADRVFGAYVNVGCLEPMLEDLRCSYPDAKFIVTISSSNSASQALQTLLARLNGADVIVFNSENANAWQVLCEHLRCVPPLSPFPTVKDLGQRKIVEAQDQAISSHRRVIPKWDRSPWVVEPDHSAWTGIEVAQQPYVSNKGWGDVEDDSIGLCSPRWSARSDTFASNLALFRPQNVEYDNAEAATIYVRRESLGVREYSAGALSSHADHLFGRFESTFQAANVPGVITGFFLHRNSPLQEIDIEILGNMPSRLLVNVFYNPGNPGAKFDYGYRGSPSYIELGFDASKGLHRYVIEWTPSEIRWLVDDMLVHRRVLWNPTPIPDLPLKLHFNAWPSRASQLAGRLNTNRLPAVARVQSIRTRSYVAPALEQLAGAFTGSANPDINGVLL